MKCQVVVLAVKVISHTTCMLFLTPIEPDKVVIRPPTQFKNRTTRDQPYCLSITNTNESGEKQEKDPAPSAQLTHELIAPLQRCMKTTANLVILHWEV